jgi:uncharacterized protein YbcV (DUF1398 family)
MPPMNPTTPRSERSTLVCKPLTRERRASARSWPRLDAAGVESYHADYRRRSTTYYLPSGASYSVALHTPSSPVTDVFDAEAVRASIRGAQRGEVRYPEFVQRTVAAGCVGYIVWITGRHVRYFGRRGEDHVEPFPS